MRRAEETVETDARTKKRQTASVAGIPVPQVHVGGLSGSGGHRHSVSSTPTEQTVVLPPEEVPQDKRSSIEDMAIGQLRVTREVREVQGVSLDADKRENFKDWPETVPSTTSEISK